MDPTQSELGGKSVKKVDTTKEARTSASPQKAHGKKLVASTTALTKLEKRDKTQRGFHRHGPWALPTYPPCLAAAHAATYLPTPSA